MECTVVVGIDQATIQQFRTTFPTWKVVRPFLWDLPWIIFFEPHGEKALNKQDIKALHADLGLKNVEYVAWDPNNYHSQREKMVTGHVYVPARYCKTRWFLKLDTDAIAHDPDIEWPLKAWFQKVNKHGEPTEYNAFAGSKWGYTRAKGGGPLNDDLTAWCDALDTWGDTVYDTERPDWRTNIKALDHPKGPRLHLPRLASWICFHNTAWVQETAALLEGVCGKNRLPVPSHDTSLWYAAMRSKKKFVITKMHRFGWMNRVSMGSIRSETEKVLKEYAEA